MAEIKLTTDEKERDECASLMYDSEPWQTFGFDLNKCKTAVRGDYKEVYITRDGTKVSAFAVVQLYGVLRGYIQTLCVSPDHRNKGVGSSLIKYCEERILKISPNVFICVSSFNTEAQKLYFRHGFEKIGVLKDHVVRGHDELILQKSVGPFSNFRLENDKRNSNLDYPNDIRICDALKIYFSTHNFNEGGYHEKYYYIILGPIRIPIPNTDKRLKAVKFHDIHHLLTNYSAFWKGEIQIGAWELASGCGNFFIAWVLNFGSFGVGLFLHPRLLFKAFMKGRHIKSNLYTGYIYSHNLLDTRLGELRAELGVNAIRPNSFSDYLSFFFWVLLVLLEAGFIILLILFTCGNYFF